MTETDSDLLHVQQASLEFNDSDAMFRADLKTILERGAHAVGVTEVGNKNRVTPLRDLAKQHGYRVVHPFMPSGRRSGEALLLNVEKGVQLVASGAVFVHSATGGRDGHPERGIVWASCDWRGNRVTFSEAHWVTGYKDETRDPQRTVDHVKMTRAMIEQVKRTAGGRELSIFLGDINEDDSATATNDKTSPDYLFKQAGLETIWDELDLYPGTMRRGGRTIDIIGSYVRDGRVSARRAKRWPKLNSDHFQVSAWYDVERIVRRPPGGAS